MDSSVKPSHITPTKTKFARAVSKVLHFQKLKSHDRLKLKDDPKSRSESLDDRVEFEEEEDLQNKAALETLISKLFTNVSSIKAAYAQLQYAQNPYDVDGIQAADQIVVSQLKNLSELKQCYLKKQFDFSSPERTMLLAEIEEQKSGLKTYEIMGKKLESQARFQDSEIFSLKDKLGEEIRHNRLIEKRLNQSGLLSTLDNLHLSGVNPSHFIRVLRHTIKSIRSFAKLIMENMKCTGWDFDKAAEAIEPDVIYCKEEHKSFPFETFVSREMFDNFHFLNFGLPNEALPDKRKIQKHFFWKFMELKSIKSKEFLPNNPRSGFAKFCLVKYLNLINPKMELSFFGDLNQRRILNSGQFPNTSFFTSFAEMARWVWLLHCLAFSFDPKAEIFQVKRGFGFSEVYMESVSEEVELLPDCDPIVGFTVFPGFGIGKTLIQCQVYLSQLPNTQDRQPLFKEIKGIDD